MHVMEVPSKIRSYRVLFSDTFASLDDLTTDREFLCVIDENVWKLYNDKLPFLKQIPEANRLLLEIREDVKTLGGVEKVYDALVHRSSKKNITLVAIGGGILQDVVGFAASTIYRGIRWVYVPTTLLAQSDSCIGGKTSLNYKGFKNLLGTFYPPYEVHVLPAFLSTLSKLDYFSGLGEVVKLHLIDGAEKTSWYASHQESIGRRNSNDLTQAIQNSLAIKIGYISEDEFDQGRRNYLNFGHCYGHALESVSHFEIPHGQAVLIGILFAGIVARNRGLQTSDFECSIVEMVQAHLVVKLKLEHLDSHLIMEAMRKDKKRVGKSLSVILMTDRHEMKSISDLTDDEFERSNQLLMNLLLETPAVQN